MARQIKSLEDRFWSKVNFTLTGCWEWTAFINPQGYGLINIDGKSTMAHRVSFELFHKTVIKDGMSILHKNECHNRKCINPAHLYEGTREDNMLDKATLGTTNRKLIPDQVRIICEEYRQGNITQIELASKYGVGQDQISRIISNKRWRWLWL